MEIFYAAGKAGEYDIGEAEEQIASTATSIEELDELTQKYSLSAETYGKAITGLFTSAAAEAESLEELEALSNKVLESGGEINAEAYQEAFERLATEALANAQTLEELDAAVAKFGLNENDEEYTQNLMRIAEGYDSCSDALLNY
jgi:hypothetical protein